MSKLTEFLKLFKWDIGSKTDLESDFNIEKALNENWDKIDEKIKELDEAKISSILKQKLEDLKNYDDSALREILDGSIKDITLDPSNGHIIFHKNDGTTDFIDTALELIIESGKYDKKTKKIVLTLANKDVIEIPLLDLLTDIYSKSEIDEILNSYEKKHTYYTMTVTEEIEAEQEVEIPCSYVVGQDNLDIFCEGEYLKCEKSADDIANWREVGVPSAISNKVQFGWNLEIGDTFTFIVKGTVEDEKN